MKLPITEEFLWDLYNLLEKTDEVFDFVFLSYPRGLREYVKLNKLKRKYERKKTRTSFTKFIYNLKINGYIKTREIKGEQGILLTKKGAEKVLKTKLKAEKKKKRKDGKWLMVMFDIPESKRRLRNLFRGYLQALGFRMIQRSVWVCPFDVIKEVDGMTKKCSLESCVKMFLIKEIEI